MMPQQLSDSLVHTLTDLALDGARRTDVRRNLHANDGPSESGSARVSSTHVKHVLAEINPSLALTIARMSEDRREFIPFLTPTLDTLPEEQLRIFGEVLGFELPGDLQDFYARIANGGVGPGNGIYTAAELVERYRWSTWLPVGPQRQNWPAHLLPICGDDWDAISIDLQTGQLVYWDISKLDPDHDEPHGAPWTESFKPVADSLEKWLTDWLQATARPTSTYAREQDRAAADAISLPEAPSPDTGEKAPESGTSFLQRYLDGQCEAVWRDLSELGQKVFEEPYHSDAMAVARETMQRARRNIEKIVQRLDGLGYVFAEQSSTKRALQNPHVFSVGPADVSTLTAQLEHEIGGNVPLSLRAWYEQVGYVSLIGSHDLLNAPDRREQPLADPLVILPLEDLLDQLQQMPRDERSDGAELIIAPDDLTKADISGAFYQVRLPFAGADLAFHDWHRTTFVNYLRNVFRWGGLPGWERSQNPPQALLSELTVGLEQI